MTKRRSRCAVIGAGLAGLTAGYRLMKAGWDVVVLEAQGRTGGRVLSERFNRTGLVCELGGEWIGRHHRRMQRLCRECDLWPLQPHRYSFTFWAASGKHAHRFGPGQWSFSEKARRGFTRLKRKFAAYNEAQMKELDQCDWWTTLGTHGFSTEELAQRDLMDSTDFGESIRLSSAFLAATEYFDSSTTDEMDFKIAGGNDRLPHALATRINGRGDIEVSAKVDAIEQGVSGVAVYVRGRKRPYRADFCICTVPAHCLLSIDWSPPLPLEQENAAKQLQYSRIMKTAVLYSKRFWREYKNSGFSVFTSRASDYCFDATYGQKGEMGILCSYAIGDKADDLASESNENNLMKWITEDVVHAVKPPDDVIVAPIDIAKKAWQREEGIGGAYAFYRPGQWFAVRQLLSRSHQRVFFAGEHLSEAWQGFMEGAVETGELAAKQVVKLA